MTDDNIVWLKLGDRAKAQGIVNDLTAKLEELAVQKRNIEKQLAIIIDACRASTASGDVLLQVMRDRDALKAALADAEAQIHEMRRTVQSICDTLK